MTSASSPAQDAAQSGRPLTGRHVLIIALCAFGVILTANMAMVFAAAGSFPGLVAKNSYVASQDFNKRAAVQAALGWSATVDYAEPTLTVAVTGPDGAVVRGLVVEALIGRPTNAASDQHVSLLDLGDGYAAPSVLSSGLWRVEIYAHDPDRPEDRIEATARLFVK